MKDWKDGLGAKSVQASYCKYLSAWCSNVFQWAKLCQLCHVLVARYWKAFFSWASFLYHLPLDDVGWQWRSTGPQPTIKVQLAVVKIADISPDIYPGIDWLAHIRYRKSSTRECCAELPQPSDVQPPWGAWFDWWTSLNHLETSHKGLHLHTAYHSITPCITWFLSCIHRPWPGIS